MSTAFSISGVLVKMSDTEALECYRRIAISRKPLQTQRAAAQQTFPSTALLCGYSPWGERGGRFFQRDPAEMRKETSISTLEDVQPPNSTLQLQAVWFLNDRDNATLPQPQALLPDHNEVSCDGAPWGVTSPLHVHHHLGRATPPNHRAWVLEVPS